jgi:hypothetical protein
VTNISSVAQHARGHFVLPDGVAQERNGVPVGIDQTLSRLMLWNVTGSGNGNGASVRSVCWLFVLNRQVDSDLACLVSRCADTNHNPFWPGATIHQDAELGARVIVISF